MLFGRVPLDIIGDIAIMKFSRWSPLPFKKIYAWNFLSKNKNVKVVLEKVSGFSGVLRVQETKWIAGEKRKDTVHKENDCSFYLDVDETYFSPRLSQDRKIMSEETLKLGKASPRVLVMFSGVSPFAIVLAKAFKKNKILAEIISSELNKKACEYGEKNIKMNKVENFVKVVCGDSRKLCSNLSKKKQKFDFIFMLRPNLEETFLESALKVSKKGTVIFYHGFGEDKKVREEILRDIKTAGRKTSKLNVRTAGNIGVNKYRFSVRFSVLN